MNEQEWLASSDPTEMLSHLLTWPTGDISGGKEYHPHRPSDRKLRLFACACRRRVPGLSWSGQSVGWQEMEDRPEREILANGFGPHTVSAEEHARLFLSKTTRPGRQPSNTQMADLLREIIGNPWRPVTLPGVQPGDRLKMLTDPYRLVPVTSKREAWEATVIEVTGKEMWVAPVGAPNERARWATPQCPWLTPTVKRLATAAYQERGQECTRCLSLLHLAATDTTKAERCADAKRRCSYCHGTGSVEDGRLDNSRLAVLADALSDAGCPEIMVCQNCDGSGEVDILEGFDDYDTKAGCVDCNSKGIIPNPILTHLRSDGVHVRGCWALDLLLGKE